MLQIGSRLVALIYYVVLYLAVIGPFKIMKDLDVYLIGTICLSHFIR